MPTPPPHRHHPLHLASSPLYMPHCTTICILCLYSLYFTNSHSFCVLLLLLRFSYSVFHVRAIHSVSGILRKFGRGMSCNGCRVLRKGCSESCILRPCLQWIDTPEAQGHATVFVAKFFGRAGLMSFISNVPENQRPALFQSLLFEACGRTVNPVNGAVGLLWTGNWHVCQAAVETVLRGGTLRPIPELLGTDAPTLATDEASEAEVTCTDMWSIRDRNPTSRFTNSRSNKFSSCKRKRSEESSKPQTTDLDLRLTPSFLQKASGNSCRPEIRRPGTPSMNSEESVTTMACLESGLVDHYAHGGDRKLLNLFT